MTVGVYFRIRDLVTAALQENVMMDVDVIIAVMSTFSEITHITAMVALT